MVGLDTYIKKSQELRLNCLKMVKKAGKGHLGGTFSIIDILVTLYYGPFLEEYPNQNKIIIGKGHANLAFLNIWKDLGLITNEKLETYGENGGIGGQLDTINTLSDNITGSLGHAVGIAAGIALAKQLDENSGKVIAIVGDGKMEEGSIWEALEFAKKQKLNNLMCIIDRNRLSVTDFIEDDNLEEKVKAFGWDVRVVDGHSFTDLFYTFALFFMGVFEKPFVVIANTIKGKGVSFMENDPSWHHGCPTDVQYEIALMELEVKC